jgi:hypothetical protein
LHKHILEPSGLELIGMGGYETSPATFDSRVVLTDFLAKATKINSVEDKRHAYPNLVLFHDGFLFCSVHLALRKPKSARTGSGKRSQSFKPEVRADCARTSAELLKQFMQPSRHFSNGAEVGHVLDAAARVDAEQRAAKAEAELRVLMQSRSMRITRPVRSLAEFIRRSPLLRPIVRRLAALLRGIRNKILR